VTALPDQAVAALFGEDNREMLEQALAWLGVGERTWGGRPIDRLAYAGELVAHRARRLGLADAPARGKVPGLEAGDPTDGQAAQGTAAPEGAEAAQGARGQAEGG
jgi:hypothetical protein